MMGGNSNYWWGMYPSSSLFRPNRVPGSSSSSSSSSSLPFNGFADNQERPQSLSLLLLGGLPAGDEESTTYFSHLLPDKLENWEDQLLNPSTTLPNIDMLKYEVPQPSNYYSHELPVLRSSFSQTKTASSPSSCVTSGISNDTILDFTYNNVEEKKRLPHRSSEYNKTAIIGTSKKARVPSSSTQPPLKVRKEKLGDRITALHQLVSPFGKTDTASVLAEAIGYIRFLHGQIEALSSPYISHGSQTLRTQHSVQPEGLSVFPEDPGQLLNDACLKRKVAPHQGNQEKLRDLRSRGLCLVPVSCTQYVGSDTGADYWAQQQVYGGGF